LLSVSGQLPSPTRLNSCTQQIRSAITFLFSLWPKREPTERERQQGKAPTTQFGRMCERLEIRIIAANSPQAKGRAERNNGVHQDLLVKKLRRKGIQDYEPRMRICKRIIFLSTTDDLRGKRRDPRTTTCARQVRRGCERFFGSRRNAGSATIGWCSTAGIFCSSSRRTGGTNRHRARH
jgi:hypothetical protein